MLSILRILIKDFMLHEITEVDCTQFKSCLIVAKSITNPGISNGLGKSSIFHAINYALYGKAPETLDDLVRDGCSQCLVEIDIDVDNTIYRVCRQRSNLSNKSELKIEVCGEDGSFHSINNETDKTTDQVLKDILKINFDSFCNSVWFTQGEFSKLASATDAQRRQVLKEPLQLAIYAAYEKIAKAKLAPIEKSVESNLSQITSLGNPEEDISKLQKEILDLQQNSETLEINRQNIKQEISSLRSQISDQEKLLSSDSVQIYDKIHKLEEQKQTISNNIDKNKKQEAQYLQELERKDKELEQNNNNLKKYQENLVKLSETVIKSDEDIHKEIEELDSKEQRGNKYIASMEAEYELYSTPLPSDAKCNKCFNEITEEYRTRVTAENAIKASEAKNNLDKSKIKINNIKKKKKELYDEIRNNATFVKNKNDISNKINEINIKNNSLAELKTNIQSSLNKSKTVITELQTSLSGLESQITTLKKSSTDVSLEQINSKITELRRDIFNKEMQENKTIQELSIISSKIGGCEEKLRQRTIDSEKLDKLLEEKPRLEASLRVHSRAAKAFSPKGIPTMIIHTILDDLQLEANKVLEEIRPGLALQFVIDDNDKDVLKIVYSVNGRQRKYGLLSGGQKMFVAFALRLGLSIVIQQRLNVKIGFLALDEVDQPFDQAGQDAFVEAVRHYQDRYKIFVVTHNDRLKDKFSHAILVENDGDNCSTGRLVTSW